MGRLAWIAIGLAIGVAALLSGYRVLGSPAGRLVFHDGEAPWIMAVEPFSAMNRQWGREQATRVRFVREWEMAEVPAEALLRVRAFGTFAMSLNGVRVPFDGADGRSWQRFQTRDVSAALHTGSNRVVVDIHNRRGPALLALALDVGGTERVATDVGFTARIGERPVEPAVRARDVRRHPALDWLPTPGQGLRGHAFAIALALAAGAALGLGLRRGAAGLGGRATVVVMSLAGVFWLLLLGRFVGMPLAAGFDAGGHLEVIERIGAGQLPLATDGWSTYHPPLYHLLVAALAPVGDALGAGAVARRLPAWLAGLGLVWLAGRLAGALHPGRTGLQAAAIGFAALLPMNVYIAGAITNEGLLGLLSAGAVVWGAALLGERESPRPAAVVAVSCWLGLALLTKYTALVAAVVVATYVLLRVVVFGASSAGRRVRDAALLIAPAAAIAGWFYLRNVLVYGRPLVANWDLPGAARIWWSAPGFHTAEYYARFGRSLVEPYYASFVSFGDGLYSTLWGDGLLSGSPGLRDLVVPWQLEWMAVGYWAAVPIALLVVVGLWAWARDVVRESDPYRAAALSLPLVYVAAMGFAIFYATLSLPFFGQARAPYGLSATPVLALAFARGLEAVDRIGAARGPVLTRAVLGAVCAVWTLCVGMAFLG